MTDEFSIQIGGILSALIGIGHCLFYRGFGWQQDFAQTRLLTAKILYTIHLFLTPMFFFFAYLSLYHTAELAGGTPLGISVSAFYAGFWLLRGIWQVVYFKPAQIKGFERLLPLHYLLCICFAGLWLAYAVPLLNHFRH